MRPALIKRAGFAIFPKIQRWRSIGGASQATVWQGWIPGPNAKDSTRWGPIGSHSTAGNFSGGRGSRRGGAPL